VHDEVVLEVDADQAEEAGEGLAAILSSGAGKVAGLSASAAAGRRWSEL